MAKEKPGWYIVVLGDETHVVKALRTEDARYRTAEIFWYKHTPSGKLNPDVALGEIAELAVARKIPIDEELILSADEIIAALNARHPKKEVTTLGALTFKKS